MATKRSIGKHLDMMAAKAEGNKTKINAIIQCRWWLEQYQWGSMLAPVVMEIRRLSSVLLPIVEQKKIRQFSEQEENDYARRIDTILIYKLFYDLIASTCRNAQPKRRRAAA